MSAAHVNCQPTMEPPSDAELARRWQTGDRAAGGRLLDRHLTRLRAFLALRCGNAADAADLAQDVFLAVCRQVGSYDPQLSFKGWLYGIARHKLADYWRNHPRPGPEQPADELVEHRSPSHLHQQADESADAWREVHARLPDAQATALWLRAQEELSVEEIARTMGVSLSNVKVLLFRARQTLTPFFRKRLHTS